MTTNDNPVHAPSTASLVGTPARVDRDVMGLKLILNLDPLSNGHPRYELSRKSLEEAGERFVAILQGGEVHEAVKLGYALVERVDVDGKPESWNIRDMGYLNGQAQPIMSQMRHSDPRRFEEIKKAFSHHPYRWDLWQP